MAGMKTSGPGRFSRRTDIPATPGLGRPGDPTELSYGDVQRLEAGAKIAGATAARPRLSTARRAEGTPAVAGGLPPFLLDEPTARPGEADTAGLSTGPGAGPDALAAQEPPDDLRILAAHWIANAFDNKAAYQLEQELLDERVAQAAPVPTAPPAVLEEAGEPTPGYAGQDVFAPEIDQIMEERPVDTTSMPGAPAEPTQMPSPSEPAAPEAAAPSA